MNSEQPKKTTNIVTKALNFLEDKINQLRDKGESEKHISEEKLSVLDQEIKINSDLITLLADKNSAMNTKFARLDVQLGLLVHKDDADNYTDAKVGLVNSDLSEMQSDLNDLIEVVNTNKSYVERCDKNIDKLESDLDEVENTGLSLNSAVKDLDRDLQILRSEVDSKNKKFDESLKYSNHHSERLEENVRKSYESLDNAKVELNRKMNEDLKALEKALNEKMNDKQSEQSKQFDDLEKFKVKSRSELERVDQQLLSIMKGGKAERNVNDFIKQIGYNADQIASIQRQINNEEL